MAQDQTVVDHLLSGRQALYADVEQANAEVERLQAEVQRLTVAIEQLDSVIGLVSSRQAPPAPVVTPAAPRAAAPAAPPPVRPARSAPAVKRAPARSRKQPGQAPKSIRVHVLEMLAAEDRDWSLAEIIDRIHDAGIQAHDDAVRSITIKLMKDGRVERVGRGQYRLTRRSAGRAGGVISSPSSPTPVEDGAAPGAGDDVLDAATFPDGDTDTDLDATDPVATDLDDTDVDDTDVTVTDAEGSAVTDAANEAATTQDETVTADEPALESAPDVSTDPGAGADRSYTPPLNLGQPWN